MRTTAEETQRNDENIIAAAIKVFSEKGYDGASMQDIADEDAANIKTIGDLVSLLEKYGK